MDGHEATEAPARQPAPRVDCRTYAGSDDESPPAVHLSFTRFLVGAVRGRHDGPVTTAPRPGPTAPSPSLLATPTRAPRRSRTSAVATAAGQQPACRPTGSSTARRAGWSSTRGCSSWPPTTTCRCWSGSGSSRSSPATSTSSSWSGSRRCARRVAAGISDAQRHRRDAARTARPGLPRSRTRSSTGTPGSSPSVLLPELARRGASRWCAGRTSPRTSGEQLRDRVHRADPPGADAARGRPGAPVPVHLRAVAEPRGRGRRRQTGRRALRAGEGAAAAPAAARRPTTSGTRLRADRGRHRRAPRPALPRPDGRGGVHASG